jgi:hypothetical protein
MLKIVNFFWQICLLRQSPEGLPSSRFSTGAIFVAYLVIALGVVLLTRPDQSLSIATATIAIGISLQAGVTFLLLQFKGYRHRFNATWSALLGANAIMLVILLPGFASAGGWPSLVISITSPSKSAFFRVRLSRS